MLLSTSSSKSRVKHWLVVWLIVGLICGFSLAGYEVFLMHRGFKPSVESTKNLWSWHRNQIYQDKTLVLLGASRSLLDLNLETIKKLLPNYNIQQLSLTGKYPIGTLISLADDAKFNGNIIISIKSEALNKAFFEMQKDWYDNKPTLYQSVDAVLSAYVQSYFVFLNPSLDFNSIVKSLYKKHVFVKPDFVNGHLDLSISADFSKMDASKRAKRYAEQSKGYWMKHDVPLPETWASDISIVRKAVEKIKARNGQVIFLRLPTDEALWSIDEEYFPRQLYWDQFMSWIHSNSIHFKDVQGLDQFDLPDDSHLDYKDSDAFTRILFNYIKEQNLLK